MDYASALRTARHISARLDLPAWVCKEPEQHKRGQYFVACMDYGAFDSHYNTGNCVAVVLPNGRILGENHGNNCTASGVGV